MSEILVNCDLGEWEPPEMTQQLMSLIDAANIACGGHAGTRESMENCVQWAREREVRIGAHPGIDGAKGRGGLLPTPKEFRELLEKQCGGLAEIAGGLHHVKLHGSLYHAVEKVPELSEVYLDYLLENQWAVFSLAGGEFSREADRGGLTVFEEVFADRGYQEDGSLIPRGQPGDLVSDPREALEKVKLWRGEGRRLTVCVHSDSPGVLPMLEALAEA